jgi:Peptidase family M28
MRTRLFRRSVRTIAIVGVVAFFAITFFERQRMAGSAIAPHSPRAFASRVDSVQLMGDLKTLAHPDLGGRLTGSEGNRRARAFILERFQRLGLQPVNGVSEQKFSFTHHSVKGFFLPSRPYRQPYPDATNVMAMVTGTHEPDRFVLLTAHYDHLGIRGGQVYPGADDNASGVAAMLAAASWFTQNRPKRSVVFVAFDGEEQGLWGARHFVGHSPLDIKQIVAVVNLDMIGRGDTNTLVVAGTYYHQELKQVVADAAQGRQITVVFGHDRPFVAAANVENWTHSSDHGPFHDAGLPFLYFGVEDHADYHQPTDTADKIPIRFYVESTNLVLEAVRRLAE